MATKDDYLYILKTMMPMNTGAVQTNAAELEAWLELVKNDKTVPLEDLVTALFLLKQHYDDLDKAVKRFYHVKDALDKFLVPERLAEAGLDQIRVPEIARSFSILDKMSASMVDKEKGFEWLRANGLGDLISETVNAGTLASAMRNMILDQGIDPPPEIIKVTSYKATSVNKYTPKAGVK